MTVIVVARRYCSGPSACRTTSAKEGDCLILDVEAGCRLDEEVGELPVIWREERCAVDIVPVQDPPGEKQPRPLVTFRKALSPGHSTGQHRCRFDWVVHCFGSCDCPFDAIEIVRLIEPLVMLPHCAVDRDRESKGWSLQWSWR